jgi:hypothetical protein
MKNKEAQHVYNKLREGMNSGVVTSKNIRSGNPKPWGPSNGQ